MADYLNEAINQTPDNDTLSKLHKTLINDCASFQIIRDVADAAKHAQLRKQKTIPRTISTSGQISRPPGIFDAPFGSGVFAEASIIVVAHDDGRVSELNPAIEVVLEMWQKTIVQL